MVVISCILQLSNQANALKSSATDNKHNVIYFNIPKVKDKSSQDNGGNAGKDMYQHGSKTVTRQKFRPKYNAYQQKDSEPENYQYSYTDPLTGNLTKNTYSTFINRLLLTIFIYVS